MEKICPIHQKELRQFKGIGKTSNKPYENWKCTYKDEKGYCEYIEWVDQIELTPKFTQTPNGVVETQEEWPLNAPQTLKTAPERTETPNSDIRTILARIEGKIDSLVNSMKL